MKNTNFKLRIFSAALAVIMLFPAISISQLTQQWVYRYDGSGHWTEYITSNSTVMDASGNLFVAFTAYHTNTGHDITIMKFLPNSPGFPVWLSGYGNTSGVGEFANAIALDNSGNIYVTGQISNNNKWDVITLKFNSNGQLQWARQYASAFNSATASCLTIDPSGNVVVSGKIDVASGNTDYLTIKYNGSGTMLWARTYDGPSGNNDLDEVSAIACDASGNVVVTGKAGWTNAGYDVVNIKYTPSGVGGATRYDGAEHSDDAGKKILFDQAGNFYVTASTIESGENPEITTMKFSPSNVPLWVKHYDFATDIPTDMKIDAAGNVYVTGYSSGNGSGTDFITLKYHTNGTQLWVQRCNEGDYAYSLALDGYNNVYVTGSNGSNTATVKYNTYGVQIGTVVYYNGPANGIDYGVAVASNNIGSTVYVVCWSNGATSYDVAMINYSQLVGVNTIGSEIPSEFELSQNYPNPFNPQTNITFSIPRAGHVKLSVFDAAGKKAVELVNEYLQAGSYDVDFNASHLSSGVYFYRFEADGFHDTKKMMLVK